VDRIPELRRALSATIRQALGDEIPQPELQVDAFVPWSDLSLELVEDLSRLAPFGAGNPPITLATETLRVVSQSGLGRMGDHMQFVVEDTHGVSQRVIRWAVGGSSIPEGYFDLAYSVSVNEFRGERELRLTWVDAKPTRMPERELARKTIELVDCRRSTDPLGDLGRILAEGPAEVWAEAAELALPQGKDRRKLEAAETLVIWTTPPSAKVLSEAVDRVAPRRIHVFGIESVAGNSGAFLKQLAGLAKHAVRQSAQTSCAELAAVSGQTEAVVRKGMSWLQAKGFVTLRESGDGYLSLTEGGREDEAFADRLGSEVRDLFREVLAYRRYFAQAEIRSLIPREGLTSAVFDFPRRNFPLPR
jgi:single-stranded-DNA-specific exonuclease